MRGGSSITQPGECDGRIQMHWPDTGSDPGKGGQLVNQPAPAPAYTLPSGCDRRGIAVPTVSATEIPGISADDPRAIQHRREQEQEIEP